ncbi:unnamed protein product, partial [Symbiodinium microadriaticum]
MGKRHMLEISVKDVDCLVVIVVRQHTICNLPAFKIVNRIPDLQLRFRQQGTNPLIDPRYILKPAGFMYFSWSDPSLPKALELVAVDYLGNESPAVTYKLENVSNALTAINVTNLENQRRELKAQVIVEGHTRVLIISNPECLSSSKSHSPSALRYDLLCSAISAAEMTISLSGISVSLIDEEPQELISLTVDTIRLSSAFNTRQWEFTINHVQLDNMLMNRTKYQDYSDVYRKPIPFFKMIMDPDFENLSLTKDAFVINYLEWQMQELLVRVDFDFLVKMTTSIITPSVLDALR